jgi:TetR/AcrR family transcriptional regulator, transcriptional repressor for nem operon
MARPREFDEEQALAAALEVFWEKGYEATSVQDLTHRMGIQKASLYNTFGDKHALFVRALSAYSVETLDWYRDRLDRQGSARGALAALFGELTKGCDQEGSCRGCLCVNAAVELAHHDPAIGALLERHNHAQEELFRRVLERGRASGDIPADLDVTATARFLLNVIAGLGVARKAGPSQQQLDDIVRVTLSVLNRH